MGVFNSLQTNIIIRDYNTANYYPVTFNVSGVTQNVIRAVLKLNNYDHGSPQDVGMLLVSPSSAASIVAGLIPASEGNPAVNAYVTLDDNASESWNGYSSGTFKSANNGNDGLGFTQVSGCPLPPYSLDMSIFNNLPPVSANGTWKLFIQDFFLDDAGTLDDATLVFYY